MLGNRKKVANLKEKINELVEENGTLQQTNAESVKRISKLEQKLASAL